MTARVVFHISRNPITWFGPRSGDCATILNPIPHSEDQLWSRLAESSEQK